MAFRLKLNEPVEKGLRRIGRDQIARARTALAATGEPGAGVHDARKAFKRIRALLRLVRPGLGDAVFKAENARYREIGAILAPSRDSAVLLETVVKLEAEAPEADGPALRAVRDIVQRELDGLRAANPDDARAHALDALDAAGKSFRRLKLEHNAFTVVEQGLVRTYRKARDAAASALVSQSADDFHEWRKGVQQHWRQMALVSRAWPEHFAARVASARRLSQLLGDDHDLAVLAHFVTDGPGHTLDESCRETVLRLAGTRQAALRVEAELRGKLLFAAGARQQGRYVAAVWTAAEALDRAGLGGGEPVSKADKSA